MVCIIIIILEFLMVANHATSLRRSFSRTVTIKEQYSPLLHPTLINIDQCKITSNFVIEGEREGQRDRGRVGGMDGGREGGRDGWREGGWEGGSEGG